MRVSSSAASCYLLPVMAVHSFVSQSAGIHLFLACLWCLQCALAQSSSVYVLDSEYSGTNFFDGWDFYTVRAFIASTAGLTDRVREAIPLEDS